MLRRFLSRAGGCPQEKWALERVFPFSDISTHQRVGKEVPRSSWKGVCTVCGERTVFSDFGDNARESGSCSLCSSFNRQRQMALAIRRQMGVETVGPFEFGSTFSIYNTETTGALHAALSKHSNYVCSEYFGEGLPGGELINGVRHEDLQALSFDDWSFDLVLSSDVLEHMPDPYRAHREIFRVLKPGGRHIFTVPFYSWEALDEVRAKLVNGEMHYFGEKLYHGDPVRPGEGILVWTIFGLEMLVKLAQIGYKPSVWQMQEPEHGIVGSGAFIFEAMRPLETRTFTLSC